MERQRTGEDQTKGGRDFTWKAEHEWEGRDWGEEGRELAETWDRSVSQSDDEFMKLERLLS